MEAFYNMIATETGKKGIFYNSDIDEKIKVGLRDVNQSWGSMDFVITNMMITCGVNYDETDFDKEYLFISNFTKPRDATQVSYRPRTLNTNIINVCYLGKMSQTSTWEIDTQIINCPIYKKMTDSIMIELKAPIRKTLQLFFNKAHYSQHTSKAKISDSIAKEIDEMIEKYGNEVGFKTIKDISCYYAEEIQQRMFCNQATMNEKFMLQKYFFTNNFTDEARSVPYLDDTAIGYAWEMKYSYYIKQCARIIDDPTNIFQQIKAFNKWNTIFPTDVAKTKLNPVLIQQIFKEFEFRTVNPKSSTAKIIESIYNAYFGVRVINTTYKGTHVTYEVCNQDDLEFVYDFFAEYRRFSKIETDSLPAIDNDVVSLFSKQSNLPDFD
jgi:hypothetical protein